MNRSSQFYVLLGTTGLLGAGLLFNINQVNNLEHDTRELGEALDALSKNGVAVQSSTGSAPVASSSGGDCLTEQDKADLAEPGNMLVAPSDCLPQRKGISMVTDQVLTRPTGSDPRGLNPYIANGADAAAYNVYMSGYLGIRDIADPDKFNPWLATYVGTEDGGLTYRVKLRKGVYWHLPTVDWDSGKYEWLKGDGPNGRHEFTADDFVFVYDILQNGQVSGRVSAMRNYFDTLEYIKAIDDHTLEIKYSKPQFTDTGMLLDALVPMPRWLYMYDEGGNKFDDSTWGLKLNEHWYNNKGIGVGPYRFVRWEPGVLLEFESDPLFWGGQAAFKNVRYLFVKDASAWPRKLKTGEVDITSLQAEQYKQIVVDGGEPYLDRPELSLTRYQELSWFYFGYNLDGKFFNDKRVRQAMTMTFDRQAVLDNVFHGLGKIHTGPYPQQVACYDHSIEPYPYDIERAKALLEEAGWTDSDGDGIRDRMIDGEKVDFDFNFLIYGSSSEYEVLASIWRESLLEAGVKMTPTPVEWSAMLKKMDERAFDVYTGAWVPGWDTDIMQIWHSKEADKPKSSNRIGFRNERADEIAVALRNTFEPEERTKLCHEFHALVHDEQPYTFFFQRERPVLYWDHFNSPSFAQTYPYQDFRYWSFNAEPSKP